MSSHAPLTPRETSNVVADAAVAALLPSEWEDNVFLSETRDRPFNVEWDRELYRVFNADPRCKKACPPVAQNQVVVAHWPYPYCIEKILIQGTNNFNRKEFAATTVRIAEPPCTILVFGNCRVVITGTKDIYVVRTAITYASMAIQRWDPNFRPSCTNLQVKNIVVTAFTGFRINLRQLARKYDNQREVSYHPDVFPGLIYKNSKVNEVYLMFVSGRLVSTGDRSIEVATDSFHEILEWLLEFSEDDTCTHADMLRNDGRYHTENDEEAHVHAAPIRSIADFDTSDLHDTIGPAPALASETEPELESELVLNNPNVMNYLQQVSIPSTPIVNIAQTLQQHVQSTPTMPAPSPIPIPSSSLATASAVPSPYHRLATVVPSPVLQPPPSPMISLMNGQANTSGSGTGAGSRSLPLPMARVPFPLIGAPVQRPSTMLTPTPAPAPIASTAMLGKRPFASTQPSLGAGQSSRGKRVAITVIR